MTILLHGPDDYRRTARQRALVEQFTEKYGSMGQQSFDAADEDDLQAFVASLHTTSLFSPRRLVVLTNALEAPTKLLKEVVARTAESKTQHAVLSDPSKTLAKTYAFFQKEPSKTEPFLYLEGAAWQKFIEAAAKKEGVTLSKELLAQLANVYEGDTWGLVTELQTLALYEKPNAGLHTAQSASLEGNLWQQLGALRNPVRARRLSILERMIASGEVAPKLFALLSYQSKITLPEAAALDLKIKSGKLDYDDALLALVIS